MDEHTQKQIFENWLAQHKGILFKIIRAYAFTPADQDDLFQEICLNLWQSIPDFRGEAKPSTWMYRVALFSATVWARQEKRNPQTDPLSEVELTLTVAAHPRDERLDWFYAQIGQLDPLDRSVCLLHLEGFSYKEIATMLGISETHVGVKIHRIKQHLIRQAQEMTHGI
ncbi:MAG: RNA polymerase sigma factor [Anaerolineales bacterium]|nr:RNA polymerase sigma factor [Anaerolineales bacterium]